MIFVYLSYGYNCRMSLCPVNAIKDEFSLRTG